MNEVGHGIRIPMPLLSLAYRAQQLQAGSGVALSTQAMAESLGEDHSRLETSLRVVAQCRPVSLDRTVGSSGDDSSLLDLIRDEHTLSPEDDYRWLHEHVQTLDAREQQLLRLRYGADERRSFCEAARLMGLTKSYTQSLERRALRKLRRQLTPVLDPPRSA